MERLSGEPRRPGVNLVGKVLEGLGLKTAAVTTVRSLNLSDAPPVTLDPVIADVRVDEVSLLSLSAAWACINLLAGTIGSLPVDVYRKDRSGRRVLATDHPLWRVLRESPNADQTALDFWEGGQAALEVRGNMHARIERMGGRIVALHPIFNPVVTRQRDGSLRYRWTENGRYYDEGQENVFHVRGFGGGPLGGLSTLAYGRQVFGLSTAVNTSAAATFANGVRPSLVFATERLLGDQRAAVERGLQDKHAGAMNAGRPMLLEGGLTPHNISFSPEDAQMLESRNFSVEEVCRFYGVPPHMIGHTAGNTQLGSSLDDQTRGFQKYALRRRVKRIEQSASKQLLSPTDRANGVSIEFNLEGFLRADSKARAEFHASGLQNGWMTINEVREIEGLPPVEGGDIPRMQMQNVPITEAGGVVANPVRE